MKTFGDILDATLDFIDLWPLWLLIYMGYYYNTHGSL